MPRRVKTRSRPATYRSALRIARIVHELAKHPYGWSFEAIQAALGISERTLMRYLAACRTDFVDDVGRPVLEVVRRGTRRYVRLVAPVAAPESTSYQALSFYFALAVFDFLDGTVLKSGVQDLWEAFRKAIPPGQQARVADFERKFYAVPWAMKDYREKDAVIDVLLQCLVQQRRARVVYDSPWLAKTDDRPHDVDPYTLAMYRGGLYVIGRSHKYRKIVYLAVERIASATKLSDEFEYPARYHPARHTQDTFGIVDGEETEVEIAVRSAEGKALLAARRLHRTQRWSQDADGTAVLTMRVRGTEEVRNWVMSLGRHVEVRRPARLRAEVVAEVEAMRGMYGGAV